MRAGRSARVAGLLTAGILVAGLAACSDGDGDGDGESQDGPQTVELGEAFTFEGFEAAAGWELGQQEATAGTDAVVMPYVEGLEVTNTRAEARFALFELVFAADGRAVSTIKCNSRPELAEGESATMVCLGMGQKVPEDYDTIVVQPISR